LIVWRPPRHADRPAGNSATSAPVVPARSGRPPGTLIVRQQNSLIQGSPDASVGAVIVW
jgi:hypothetical protein